MLINTVTPKDLGWWWWQPWANTLAYYPLSADFNDASWNGYNLTNSWWSITTVWWVGCAYYDGSSYSLNTSNPIFSWTYTISVWRRPASTSWVMWMVLAWTSSTNVEWDFWWLQQSSWVIWASDWYTLNRSVNSNFTVSADTWYLLTTTVSNYRDVTIYVNWALKNSLVRWNSLYNQTWVILWAKKWNVYSEMSTWYISNVIFEDKVWTVTEIADYFDQTKSNYWL